MTITDDDEAPTVSIADASTSDEAAGPTNLTVTLSAASEKTITVQYATSDGIECQLRLHCEYWHTYF